MPLVSLSPDDIRLVDACIADYMVRLGNTPSTITNNTQVIERLRTIRVRLERFVPSLDERTSDALLDVSLELARARAKFPNNTLLLAALLEEAGDLANALIEGRKGDPASVVSHKHTYEEAIQVACVAVRIATEGSSEFESFDPSRVPSLANYL